MFLALLLASCTTVPTETREYNDPVLISKPHTILANEQIKITVFGQIDLSNTYTVDDRGQISMPLLGVIPAYGKTPAQMSQFIAFLLSQKYIRNPSVNVEMVRYSPIYISGAINNAGQFTYAPGMTVAAAIASAGGFSSGANRNLVRITRRENGKIKEASVALPTPLAAGDIIQVFGSITSTQ